MKKTLLLLSLSFLVPSSIFSTLGDDPKTPICSPSPDLISRFELLQLMPKNGIVAELGVGRGDFSAAILKHANPQKLYLIDCWETDGNSCEKQKQNYAWVKERFADDSRVVIIKALSAEAVKLFKNNFFDWFYLDANHSFKSVSEDLETWYPKIKSGGIFTGHGYTSHLLRPSFGVVQALNEFIKKHNLEMLYLTNETFANWAIKKPVLRNPKPCEIEQQVIDISKENA